MLCEGCGSVDAYALKRYADGSEECDSCGGVRPVPTYSVYFRKEYIDPNLGHPQRPWEANGVLVTSKRHKAMLLREQGLMEVGDRKHGARNFDKTLARAARDQGHNPDGVPN